MTRSKPKSGGKTLTKRLAKAAQRKFVQYLESRDLVAMMENLSQSPWGRIWLDKFTSLTDEWSDTSKLDALAVELTLAQLRDEGRSPDPDKIVDLIQSITCDYDHHLAVNAIAGLTTIMNELFDQEDESIPFQEPDGSDFPHLEQLLDYRRQGLGVVYLVNHSSHFDEFLVDCVLLHNGVGLPLFAAGQNMMKVKSIAKILMMGSYVVQRRGAGRQDLAGLFNFCRALAETGGQNGIFLEAWHGGARTRDGSLRYPRRLIALRGAIAAETDVVIQPAAVSFSMIPEDMALSARAGGLSWLRGVSPTRTAGRMLFHPKSWLWRTVQNLYGRAYVTFPRPRLLSEFKADHDRQRSDLQLDEFISLEAIRAIAKHKKVMTSQLTARGLDRARRWGKGKLVPAVKYEMERMNEYHRTTFNAEPAFEKFIREHTLADSIRDGMARLRQRGVVSRMKKDASGLPLVRSEAGLSYYATHGDRRIYSPTARENVVVVGSNDWGFALTSLVGRRLLEDSHSNSSLTLFDARKDWAVEMSINRRPPGRFSEMRLPKNAFVTSDPPSAFRKASEVVVAESIEQLPERLNQLYKHSIQPINLVMATCNFDPVSRNLPAKLALDLAREAGRTDVTLSVLVGPITEEQILGEQPVAGVLAGPAEAVKKLSGLLTSEPLSVVAATDPIGAQAAAVLARVYALWGNVLTSSGQFRGAAQTGYYMAAAAAEASQLGTALGASAESFAASSAAWTATFTAEGLSPASMGRRFARRLGGSFKTEGKLSAGLAKSLKETDQDGTDEAILPTLADLAAARYWAREFELDLPILEKAYKTVWTD